MAIKKSQFYSALWEGCNKLRGGMDASQYKDYVLVVLFVKYISDKAKKDTEMLIDVPEGCTFDDMVALKGKTNIGEEMNKILAKLAEANDLTGVITNADFADENKLGKAKDLVNTVSDLIGVFQREELDFSNNRAADDDLIGDAYEYLMKNFASESGKSKGQFYTPAEVSRVMAKAIGIGKDERQMISIYDPTCGSGSLLLRAKAEAKHNASIDGQEKDLATIGMARMSMIIHGVDDAELRHGDTLNDPLHKQNDTTLQQFDYVVANPPFSMKGWKKSANDQDLFGRWGVGDFFAPVPPSGCGDYAFLLHIVASLKSQGHAACILPHGVLFRSGVEAEIRKYLIKKHYISGIIGLPSNLFFGTGIPACIIIIDKEHSSAAKGVFMIDAKEGYQKDGAKNRLREQDLKLIVDTWEVHEDVPHYARFVKFSEIEANDNNLNIPRYVIPEDKEIQQDIYAHLHGGLPTHDVDVVMSSLWEACPTLKDNLFKKEANGYYSLVPDVDKISDTVDNDPSYIKQNELYAAVIEKWCKAISEDMYAEVQEECEPKMLIAQWGEKLLAEAKRELKLVAPYNVYEILMNYWAETMQDDCYMVSRDGWKASLNLSSKKKYTFKDCSCDLLPIPVIVNEYFKIDYEALKNTDSLIEQYNSDIDTIIEEHPDDFGDWFSNVKSVKDRVAAARVKPASDGEKDVLEHYLTLLAEGSTEAKKKAKDYVEDNAIFRQFEKVGKGTVAKRLKEIGIYDPLLPDTLEVLENYLAIDDKLSAAKAVQKELLAKITASVVAKYAELTTSETRSLVIEKKWMREIQGRCANEIRLVSDDITNQMITLYKRYANPLPKIEAEVNKLSDTVKSYLKSMGIE